MSLADSQEAVEGINPTSSAPVGGGLGEGSGGSGPSEGTPPTDNERVTGLLRAAGFDDVQAAEFLTTVGWGESFSDWATFKASFINTVINTHPDTAKATLVEDLVKEHLNRFKARAYADQLVTYVSSTFRRPDEEQRGVGSSWSSITNVRKTAHFYLTQTETGPVVNEAQKEDIVKNVWGLPTAEKALAQLDQAAVQAAYEKGLLAKASKPWPPEKPPNNCYDPNQFTWLRYEEVPKRRGRHSRIPCFVAPVEKHGMEIALENVALARYSRTRKGEGKPAIVFWAETALWRQAKEIAAAEGVDLYTDSSGDEDDDRDRPLGALSPDPGLVNNSSDSDNEDEGRGRKKRKVSLQYTEYAPTPAAFMKKNSDAFHNEAKKIVKEMEKKEIHVGPLRAEMENAKALVLRCAEGYRKRSLAVLSAEERARHKKKSGPKPQQEAGAPAAAAGGESTEAAAQGGDEGGDEA